MSASGSPKRCRAWVLARADGAVMGFTDHDREIAFIDSAHGAVALEPSSGFTASAFADSIGLGRNDMDIGGAIRSDKITVGDLGSGVYDGAEVRYYWIDWSDPTKFDLISVSRVAEILRNQNGFSSTIEGLSAKANEPVGLRLTRNCGLEFGGAVDTKNGQGCGLDLSAPAFSQAGVVSRVLSDRSFAATGMTLEAGLCSFGKIKWVGGGEVVVKSHTIRGPETIFELDYAAPVAFVVGAGFTAEAGCDKGKDRCAQFSNLRRRLAFPVPADNVATKYARDLAPNSGDSGTVGVGG